MQDSSDEVIKQILINSDERDIQNLCSTNKRFAHLCQDVKFMESVYRQKVENTISSEILAFKASNMSWREFYTRIYELKNNPAEIGVYCVRGDLLEIQILMNMNPPILPTQGDANNVAKRGHLDVLKYLVSQNISPTQSGVEWIAAYGHMEVIKYLISLGLRPTSFGASWTAAKGHLDVLKYLVSQDIRPTSGGAELAAENGHLDVLTYLVSLGIRPTQVGADSAAINGHLEILKYLISLGILPTQRIVNMLNDKPLMKYLASLNPPIVPN